MIRQPRVLAIAALFVTAGAGGVLAQSHAPTLVAVVRADGVVLPFARFDGRRWATFPPAGADSAFNTPETRDLPHTWQIHLADGTSPRRARGGSTVVFNTEGENWYDRWGQTTDIAPRLADSTEFPAGRVGVAVSGTVRTATVATFARHPVRSAVWRRFQRDVVKAFGRAETHALSQDSIVTSMANWPRVRAIPDSAERATRSVELRSLYVSRARAGTTALYYVDARKVYPAGAANRDCQPAVYYQAWLRQTPGTPGLRVVTERVTPGYACDRPGATPPVMVPFGALRTGGRTFIVGEEVGYESSARRLLEVTRTTVKPAF